MASDREDRLLCLSLLFAGDRDRHLVAVNGLVQLLIGSINEWGFRCNVIYTLIPFILLCFVRLQGKKMERKRKEREVELKEKKTGDVESTTISTITPVDLSIEISSKTTK